MIVFDLDGTLADCEHRRHFLARPKPNWDAFHEACDKDEPNTPVCKILDCLMIYNCQVQVWSARSESTREKTEAWFQKHIRHIYFGWDFELILKMRPIGDYTPDEQLKERWLDEVLAQGKTIEFVVDDRPKVVRMWRRRGIFVFDVNQTGKEF